MYGNNYNNNNNNNYNQNYSPALPSGGFNEYGNSSWQSSGGWSKPMQQTQQNWGSSPSSPKVTPPMMNGMGMGMPALDMGMGMNNGMGMGAPARKQWSDPQQYQQPYSNNNYGSDNLDVNSAKNLNVNVNVQYAGQNQWGQNNNNNGMGMGMNNGMGMGYNNNGGYNDYDMKMMASRNASPSMVAMTSLAYRTAAYSMPMAPDSRGDTQFSGVAPETYNGMQNVFGGAGMYKSTNYEEHQGPTAQYLRDAVLGINDGLVSMLLLTLGLAGGNLGTTQILLAGITGAVGGAISMALGEYIATKSQGQVTAAELKLEKEHLMNHREKELGEVRTFMQELNLEGELLEKCVAAINSRDEAMIRLMMAFEFGFQEELERNPIKAMLTSGSLFLTGSLPSVLPYAVTTNANTALFISIALACVALFGIGAGKCKVTKGPWLNDGLENLILGAIGGAATFGLGKAYGSGKTTTA